MKGRMVGLSYAERERLPRRRNVNSFTDVAGRLAHTCAGSALGKGEESCADQLQR